MAVQQFQASATLQEGVKVNVKARDFSFTIDEPTELGGTNTGMNPVEALLGSLAACQSIVARVYAQQCGVQLDALSIDVEGDLDLDGFFDRTDVRPGYSEIRYDFHIQSPSPRAHIDKLIERLHSHCPVGDSLAAPVTLRLNQVNVEATAAA